MDLITEKAKKRCKKCRMERNNFFNWACMKIMTYEICLPRTASQARFAPCTPPRCLVECGDSICAHVVDDKVYINKFE